MLRFWFDRGADGIRIDSAALLMKDGGAGRLRPGRPAVPAPVHRPGRGARRLPGVARHRRQLSRAAGADRRGVAARRPAVRRLHAPGRDPHRVQLRLPRLRLGRRRAARRSSTRRWPCTRRSSAARDLGAVQSRRSPPRHPVRPRGHVVHPRVPPARRAHRPGARACAGPGPRCCSASRCPARSTCTRARSWAWRRSRTSRTSCARTRCSSAPRGRTWAGTAAGCRCRGRATSRRSASARPARAAQPWLPQPAAWRDRTVEAAGRRPRLDAGAVPPGAGLPARRAAGARRRAVRVAATAPTGSSRSAGGRTATFACVVNLSERPVALPVAGTIVLTSGPLDDDLLPPDTAAWLVTG